MIKLENVSKVYERGSNKVTAVNNVSLEIAGGEFVAIVGTSGCGKSTLLNLIGGLDDVSDGYIYYGDESIGKFNAARRSQYRNKDIGFIFQSYHLEQHFSVSMNVALPLIVAGEGKKERDEKSLAVLAKLGLKNKAKVKPTELSGGEMQRVAIARAIINNPKLLLADEPTGNLDTASGNKVMNYLKAINREGVTVILVTHNMEHTKYCSRVITMQDGVIISDSKVGQEDSVTCDVEASDKIGISDNIKIESAVKEELCVDVVKDSSEDTTANSL